MLGELPALLDGAACVGDRSYQPPELSGMGCQNSRTGWTW
jgi:hypothetical protein